MNIIVGKQFLLVNSKIINNSNFSLILGNVYRGCARKRCAVSHTIGTFSSSVCCETDYCNGGINRTFSSRFLFIIISLSTIIHQDFW